MGRALRGQRALRLPCEGDLKKAYSDHELLCHHGATTAAVSDASEVIFASAERGFPWRPTAVWHATEQEATIVSKSILTAKLSIRSVTICHESRSVGALVRNSFASFLDSRNSTGCLQHTILERTHYTHSHSPTDATSPRPNVAAKSKSRHDGSPFEACRKAKGGR